MHPSTLSLSKTVALLLGSIVVAATLALSFSWNASSGSANVSLNPTFGGRVGWVFPCICSFNWIMVVGPPKPAVMVFQPGFSKAYMYYQVFRPGPNVLGQRTNFGSCRILTGIKCIPFPVQGTVIQVGTSMM